MKEIPKIIEKYYRNIAIAILLITVILLFLSETFPLFKNILIDKGAINILVLIFVIGGIDYLIAINEKLEEKDITFYENQPMANSAVYKYINDKHPTKADLLEYSSTNCTEVISSLGTNCKIRLLIAHPDIASVLQQGKIIGRIRHIVEVDYEQYRNVDVKCYKNYNVGDQEYTAFGSIRGRKFGDKFGDNFICIGWYTPTTKMGGGLCGHMNPMICGYIDNEPARILKKHFDDTFNILWENGISKEEVYDNLVRRGMIPINP